MGVVTYDKADNASSPLSEPFLFDIGCSDEPYNKLTPYKKWTVKDPVNIGMLSKARFMQKGRCGCHLARLRRKGNDLYLNVPPVGN